MNKFNPDLYTENNETLLKYIKEDLSKWKHTLCSWTGSPNFANLAYSAKRSIQWNCPCKKKVSTFFLWGEGKSEEADLNIHMEFKGSKIVKTFLKK